jgi:hypothetical protein
MLRRSRVAVFALTLALAGGVALAAQDATVQVTQVRASGKEAGPKEFAPEVADLAKALAAAPYHRFERVGVEAKPAPEGQATSYALRGGYTLVVTARAGEKGKIVLDVALQDASGTEKFSTKLKLADGATVLIGKDFEDGDGHLYLALTAKRGS